jgi:deoxyribodipyrimidine photolyase-related protein
MDLVLVFPHQLFDQHPALYTKKPLVLIEEWLFFRQFNFHKQKLLFHRASMQFYKNWLIENGYEIWRYIESHEADSDIAACVNTLKKSGCNQLHIADPADDWALSRIKSACAHTGIHLQVLPSPNFLTPASALADWLRTKKPFFQTGFYIEQRKRLNILLNEKREPLGGSWTYDAENRQRLPKNHVLPTIQWPEANRYTIEAQQYVAKYFPNNYGQIDECYYPTTYEEANLWLRQFLEKRLAPFGAYEDAMKASESVLYHSVLSPLMNVGLLQPDEVLQATMDHTQKNEVPLNSVEGFVRQIIGWREFIKMVYDQKGRYQRSRNFWQFQRKIPASFWQGNTGIAPIDMVVKKAWQTGYNHHIERLMVLGNFFLLCEFSPDEVYRWFMEMYVDAYDWVMVPNVYGMTQFADGGLMTTKPYISGSNYLLKMGDWPKGKWQEIWDALFWRFMHVHRNFFTKNPRLSMLVNTFDKMTAEKKQNLLHTAEKYLATLDAAKH